MVTCSNYITECAGGNAKTLMFVNISPADYNMDETVVSLTWVELKLLIYINYLIQIQHTDDYLHSLFNPVT